MGILLRYSDVGYRVLLNNKMIVARHVDIVKENVKCIGFDDLESKFPSPSTSTFESSRGEENYRDNDLIGDNVFQSADGIDEQELKVVNNENLDSWTIKFIPSLKFRTVKNPT